MLLSLLDLAAIFLALIAFFGWLNLRILHLPMTVGLMLIGLLGSVGALIADRMLPGLGFAGALSALLSRVDFTRAVLNFMLSFLLFASGMNLDITAARGQAWTAGTLATIGVFLSTALVGFGFWLAAGLFGLHISLAWCLVFGALISPTDPAAILATLKYARLPAGARTLIHTESLFNDGVGIVLFTALLSAAMRGGGVDVVDFGWHIVVVSGGAAVLGLGCALVALRGIRGIDDYGVETAITLALATGVYALSDRLGLSGPIAAAVAGIVFGSEAAKRAMSETTQRYIRGLWNLVDVILNAALFLLIGLEVLVVRFDAAYAGLAVLAILLVLVARLISVSVPALLLARSHEKIGYWIIPLLTWAGARGGISIALALSLHSGPQKTAIVMATYLIVLFSVFVQSMTIPQLLRWVRAEARQD